MYIFFYKTIQNLDAKTFSLLLKLDYKSQLEGLNVDVGAHTFLAILVITEPN